MTDKITLLEGNSNDERDVVNQLLGQVQMANSIARFADVVSLTKLAHIKENRMYKALAGKKGVDPQGNEIADIGTFDGFCKALGLSRSKVDEDLTNLKFFGEEALNNLTAIGVGYREMRQYRRLPDDQKVALLEVAKEGDKDSFIDLAEQIISRHTKEKEELQSQVSEQESVAADLAIKLDTAMAEKESLVSALKKERAGSDYPDYVVVTRHESAAVTDKALLCIDDLSRLSNDLISFTSVLSDPTQATETISHITMSASSLQIHLQAILAKTTQALSLLQNHLGDYVQPLSSELIYSESELTDMIQNRELLVQDHKQEAAIRANKRAAEKPRGRGRPKKSETEE